MHCIRHKYPLFATFVVMTALVSCGRSFEPVYFKFRVPYSSHYFTKAALKSTGPVESATQKGGHFIYASEKRYLQQNTTVEENNGRSEANRQAVLSALAGNWNEAGKIWQKLSEANGAEPAYFNNLSVFYSQAADSQRAIMAIERAMALDPDEEMYRYQFRATTSLSDGSFKVVKPEQQARTRHDNAAEKGERAH